MKIIHTSFGYDMTINVYAKVLSETAKTMLVQEIGATVNDDNGTGNGRAFPDASVVKGEPFRVYKRNKTWDGSNDNYYKGKLPGYSSVDFWTDYERNGKGNYHNTWD